MNPVIKVENISKRYQIGGLNPGYATFREFLAGAMITPLRRLRRTYKPSTETIWALRDIDFNVELGEVVGIIGHNGAGKSTLLKILSRITVPTSGRTEVRGRIGTLLEIGTGFHPDLTGRENIFLNGAIIGIGKAVIARKFDEIVAFSGIEQFIDTPVKWYSTGMALRLAFSVAVHLDSEVLIMDEVLAVGDVSFQQKCLDKMNEIRNQGRTILFVSHSMAAVTRLCKRALLLEKGHLIDDGPAHQVVNDYLESSWKVTAEREWPDYQRPGNAIVKLIKVRVRSVEGTTKESTDIQSSVGIEISYDVLQSGHALIPKVDVVNEEGIHLFASHDVSDEWRRKPKDGGRYISTIWIPGNFLSEGNFLVHASVVSHKPETATHVYEPKAVAFQVVDNRDPDSARGDYVGPISGVVRPLLKWDTRFDDEAQSQRDTSETVSARG